MGISASNKQVVVAIDFGTSRSGYAYALTQNPKITGRTEWDGQSIPYSKTLTHLLYNPDGSVEAWGWQAKRKLAGTQNIFEGDSYLFFQNFKMKLRGEEDTPRSSPVALSSDKRVFAVTDLISDYLTQLKDLALDEIKTATVGHLKDDEVLWCLTIPAIWKDAEKQLMRQAAQKAGLIGAGTTEAKRLLLVLEPEAAAIYCMEKEKAQLAPGCKFMVVDCGGGTVDITVHEILADRRLKEVVPGGGGPYGSTYIDDEFENFLKQKLSDEVVMQYRNDEPVAYLETMETWERIKCDFNPQSNLYPTNFPISRRLDKLLRRSHPKLLQRLEEEQQGVDDYILLDHKTMLDIFTPTISNLIQSVEDQFQKLDGQNCDYLFLVGGFSSCALLQQHIRETFGKRVKKVVIPPNPGAAIVEGAVSYGLNPSIIPLRRSRLTYGCGTAKPFDPDQDPEDKKFRSSYYNNALYCDDRFDIFVKAGEVVEAGKSVSRIFEPQQQNQKAIDFRFYSTEQQEVRYTDEPSVDEIGQLAVELPKVELPDARRKINVTMYFGDTEIKVEATDQETGRGFNTTLRFFIKGE